MRADREEIARTRAATLEGKLTRVSIVVPAAARISGLEVQRDGAVVREGQWGVAVAVDPGAHEVSVTAPGKKSWRAKVEASGAGKVVQVEVPSLEDAPPGATPAEPTKPAPARSESTPAARPVERRGGSPIVPLVLGGAGVVAIGIGSFFGVRALSLNSDSNANCDGNRCDATGFATREDARSAATWSTVLVGAGAALLVGAVVVWIVSPSATKSARFVPRGAGFAF
jgi:hypothetical protein